MQSVQDELADNENVPAVQLLHDELPMEVEKVPEGHEEQAEDPDDEKDPTGQEKQDPKAKSQKLPALQETHTELPATE